MPKKIITAALAGTLAVLTSAQASEPLDAAAARDGVSRLMVTTDGMIDARAARRLRPRPVSQRPLASRKPDQSNWLFEYLSRLLDREPTAARRNRGETGTSIASRHTRPIRAMAPDTRAVRRHAAPSRLVSDPATSPLSTGSLAPIPYAPPIDPEQLIVAAERSQLRSDFVKLEFASRTYDEQKFPGQLVFQQRDDWRVLERARDALSDAERASASIAGFEANAYINDTTRTIVVAVAGTQALRRDLLGADIWYALIAAEAPQQFYLAKTYVRSVIQRYQSQGFTTECVGHSLGGGACAYAAAELGIRALVLNPISAGRLAPAARFLVTNYVVDGDIAHLIYNMRGNEFSGDIQVIRAGRDAIRQMTLEKYGQLAGPILVVRELRDGINSHKAEHALDLIAAQAETERPH